MVDCVDLGDAALACLSGMEHSRDNCPTRRSTGLPDGAVFQHWLANIVAFCWKKSCWLGSR